MTNAGTIRKGEIHVKASQVLFCPFCRARCPCSRRAVPVYPSQGHLLIWVGLLAALAVLFFTGVLGRDEIFLVAVFFFVCDLICVLVWCPFRLIMRNKCCTTCRIFNWDHLMMFSPFVLTPGFYTTSLLIVAFAAWVVWEVCVMVYPERFWERTNVALQCANCTDKLCTQYCRKLRQ